MLSGATSGNLHKRLAAFASLCVIRALAVFALLALILSASGCFSENVDGLYSLPAQSEKYLKLQALINAEIMSGSEFSAPTRGSFRQSVQQYDLDGDGADESLAFFLGAENAMKICVYRGVGDDYELAATITGEGTAIGSIEYADLDGDGLTELIVTWQSGDMRILQVYSFKDFSASVILKINCYEFITADIDRNDISDLLVVRFDSAEGADRVTGIVEMYSFTRAGEPELVSAALSIGLEAKDITRLRMGELSDLVPALFIEAYFAEDELITDILAYTGGKLTNISLDEETGISRTRRLNVKDPYSRDIDNDRIMETPETVPMVSQPGTSSVYWVFDWYCFDSTGEKRLDLSTYHATDGWLLVLPEMWREGFTARREDSLSGERVVVLSVWDENYESVTDLLTVYTLTGDNRRDRSKIPGRFVIYENDTTIYAGKIMLEPYEWEGALTREELIGLFRLIYLEWTTGAI